ncbi:F-box WD repeat-containing 7 [Micractinium conductrix]|uniref:F-box WD repeat-containing 7 n=1 Tax=Micractinium conductrix TaxID=554055 RepID=A0A2P6VLF3_9CHLO|nr:F-box WD repeat-containing 7 [Micractinium conductrix]|eukprot:PSC74914.1 F-box WD repeat-containing 7 [Micractinium conductrix]
MLNGQTPAPGASPARHSRCVHWDSGEAVLGAADHAAHVLCVRRGVRTRTLHTKTSGHKEWVTAVAHLLDGRVATGGQDSAVWLWPAGGTSGRTAQPTLLDGHAGPVSQLAAVPAAGATGALLSAGYDKRLLLWACGSGGCAARQQQSLAGHRAPVLQLAVAGSCSASGDRDGAVLRFDLAAAAPLGKPLAAHAGHCTALEWLGGGSSLLSGGQDGVVRQWDCRQGGADPAAASAAHASPQGRGAVGSIAPLPGSALVATAGVDCRVCGLDSRQGLQPAWTARLPDYPYSLAAAPGGDTILVGCGDGSILALEAGSGSERWRVATKATAVRTLHASDGTLLAGCDDGSAVLYAGS